MRIFRLAAVAVLLVALAEAAWWASKNRPHLTISQSSGQPQTSTTLKPVLAQVNSPQASSPVAPGATSASSTTTSNATTTGAETERLGPFSLSGTDYTLVLKKKKRQPGPTKESGDTVVAMEIRDGGSSILYQRDFPYQPNETEFSDAWSVSAGVLSGTNGTGLLVRYDLDLEPSAPEPESNGWYQVFGVVNGKFKAFSGPILVQGGLISAGAAAKQFKTAGPLDSHSDALNFKVWAHHFRFIYPVRVDWSEGKLSPAQVCNKTNPGGSSPPCHYAVMPENERQIADLTFVQLCPDSSPCDHPERVLVKKDSKLELLTCTADVKWSEGLTSPTGDANDLMRDQGGISIGENNIELMVRVDGKEGWISAYEDFNALGLILEQ